MRSLGGYNCTRVKAGFLIWTQRVHPIVRAHTPAQYEASKGHHNAHSGVSYPQWTENAQKPCSSSISYCTCTVEQWLCRSLCSKYLHCVSRASNWVHQGVCSISSSLYYFIIFQIVNLFDVVPKGHKQITLIYDASSFLTDFSEGTVLRSTKGMSQYFWSLRAVTYNSRGVMILSFVFLLNMSLILCLFSQNVFLFCFLIQKVPLFCFVILSNFLFRFAFPLFTFLFFFSSAA